ncbi:MAG: NADase-type glycan-binding domain-containing protein [Streptosporangiales bacterium]
MAEIVCPHCHLVLPPAGAFCPGCGSFVGSSDAADIHERAVEAWSTKVPSVTEVAPAPPPEEPVPAWTGPPVEPDGDDEAIAPRRPVPRRSADPYPSDTALGRPNAEHSPAPEPKSRDRHQREERPRRKARVAAGVTRARAGGVALSHRVARGVRRLGPMPVVVALVVAALLVSGGVFYLSGHPRDPGRRPHTDPVHVLTLGTPDATCAAPASVNASGEKVTFGPRHLVDGKTTTAWRCAGDGSKQKVTFALPRRMQVTKLAVVPGWATQDEKSKANRFAENGAPTAVTWHLAGHRVKQRIGHSKPTWSSVRPKTPVSTRRVTLTIDSVRPGNRRDMVAVSEVRVYGR